MDKLIFAIIFSLFILSFKVSISLAIIISIAFMLFFITIKNPLNAFCLLLFILPFTGMVYFNDPVFAFTGVEYLSIRQNYSIIKPVNLLIFITYVVCIINIKNSNKLQRESFVFVCFFIFIFFVCIIRALPNLEIINSMGFSASGKALSVNSYFFSYFIKQLAYFGLYVLVIMFVKSNQDVERVIKIIIVQIFAISVLVILQYSINVYGNTEIENANEAYFNLFGMHRNNIGTFYVLAFPLVLSRITTKGGIYSLINCLICLIAIGLLFSRTVYLLTLFSIVMYFIVSRSNSKIPILIIMIVVCLLSTVTSIKDRALTGVDSNDFDKISAGRVEKIWTPLVQEYVHDPKKLLFGNGRHSILSSEASRRGLISVYNHPHNMYLEFLIDAGLPCLLLLVYFYGSVLKKLYLITVRVEGGKVRGSQCAFLISLLAFFIAGLSGRTMFPAMDNCYFWVILGLVTNSISHLERTLERVNGN